MKEFFVETRHAENGLFSIDEDEFMKTVPETHVAILESFNVCFSENKATLSVEVVKKAAAFSPKSYDVGRSSGRTHKF